MDNFDVSSTNNDLDKDIPWSMTSDIRYGPDKEVTTGYESESDTGSESSFNTTVTDHTFTIKNLQDVPDSSGDSYHTHTSRTSRLSDELSDLKKVMPFQKLASYSICEADISSSVSPGVLLY